MAAACNTAKPGHRRPRVDTLRHGMVRAPPMKPAALLLCLWCWCVAAGAGLARAQRAPSASTADAVSPAPGLTPTQAQQVLDVLQDPAKRAQFVSTLEAMAKALPAPADPAKPSSAPAPASPAKLEIAPNSLGARLVHQSSQGFSQLSAQVLGAARTLTDFPMLWRWARGIASDRNMQEQLARAGWRLLLVLGAGLAAEWLIGRLLRRPRRLLCEHGPPATWKHGIGREAADNGANHTEHDGIDSAEAAAEAGETEHRRRHPSALTMMRRVPFVVLGLLLDLIPIGGFTACSYGVLALLAAEPNARLAILAIIEAYVTWRVVLCITRMFVAPAMPRMRLVHVSDAAAAYIARWVGLIVGVAVFGRAVSEISLLYGLYPGAQAALLKLFMLIAHLLLVVVVLQNRRAVAERIRAPADRTGSIARLRNFLADTWHYIAIFYVLALWLVWAFEVRNGYARLLHVFAVTAAILLVSRLVTIVLLGALDRGLRLRPDVATRFPELQARAHRYHPILRGVISAVMALLTLFALCQSWGLDVRLWFFAGSLGGQAVSAIGIIGLILLLAMLVWETANLFMQRHLRRLIESGQGARAARLKTVLPIIRAVLLIIVAVFAGLTALGEMGVNIAPLLAGAGIVGVAVGFGSQKLVQDFITGIFLLFENAMQVGDWVTVAGLSGTVETLSIRTLRLRGADGSVYIIPFSSVTTVNNTNRGLGNVVISVNVSYREDTDRVGGVLREIAAEMRQDSAFQRQMLGELELWGVDKVEGSAVTIAGQIACTDAGRWPVQREFNRRMKQRFQELGIEIPNPTHTIVLQPTAGVHVRAEREADGGETPTPVPVPFAPIRGGSPR